jgi:hypothetical protein
LLPARPRGTASGSGVASRNSFGSGFAFNRFGFRDSGRFRNFDRFGFHGGFPRFPFSDFDNDFDDFFPFRSPFFGCFGCGFGFFGFNFGFSAPLWWGPTWPWWSGGYPYGPPYGYSLPYDAGLIYNSPAYSGPQSDDSSASGTFSRTAKSAENSSAILLYLKDGTMYSVRDSWLANGKLHYTAMDRTEGVVELDAVDFQRTVDENAQRGAPFTLKPNPTNPAPSH